MPETNDKPIAEGRPCPICSKPAVIKYRPFCSKRCADIDLHRWLAGSYAVPAAPDLDDASESESVPPPLAPRDDD